MLLVPGSDPLQAVFDFQRGLLAGDLAAVAATLHPLNRERNLEFVRQLDGHLAEAAAWLDRVELLPPEGDLARARVLRETTVGGERGDFEFEILLLRDPRGEWKLLDF